MKLWRRSLPQRSRCSISDVDVFGIFINQAPARAPQAPPVVHVRMHYPADFEHHLAGALTLIFGCFDLIFGYGVTETIGSLSRPA
jgi:hypothetical protein